MAAGRFDEYDGRAEHWLLWAFLVSLLAHLLLYGGFLLGNHLGLWKKDALHSWLTTPAKSLAATKKNPVKPPVEPQEVPLNFIEVDPAAITAEPPKNAKFYSSKNSQAANKEADIDSNIPKLNGQQTHTLKTETAPRAKSAPLQPAPAKNANPDTETAEAKAKPKGGPQIGDLAMAKPNPHPENNSAENDTGEAPTPVHKRPRTLVEAKSQKALAGEKMKQEGGVKRRLIIDSMDAKATPFGEYDRELIEAIQNHWYDLLDQKNYSRDGTGRVTIEFRLDYSGHISDLKVIGSEVDEILTLVCQLAIRDPAPFAPWPADMRRFWNSDYRDVRFTFYYE